MDFTKDVKKILEQEIRSIADYKMVVTQIQEKMNESAKYSNYNIDNMCFFYRGDSNDAPLCPKIFRNNSCLSSEGSRFRKKFKLNKNVDENELHFLCRLQHEYDCTRLLDFSTDPLVALRFACGHDNENYDKRITMIYTDHIKENNQEYLDAEVATLLKMVKSDELCNFDEKEKRQLSKDYIGYIVNIPIDKKYVEQLRNELDKTENYSIKHLLAE